MSIPQESQNSYSSNTNTLLRKTNQKSQKIKKFNFRLSADSNQKSKVVLYTFK